MSEVFETLLLDTTKRLEKIGLYTEAAGVGGTPMNEEVVDQIETGQITEREAIKSGVAEFSLYISCRIGDVAWSDRVLNPEDHKNKQEFEKLTINTEVEMTKDEISRALEDWDE